MADVVRAYFNTSTLFIVRYISDRKKTFLERCLWLVLLVFSSGQLVSYLLSDWATLRSGPLWVAVEDTRLSVGSVDFPAITLCPTNVIDPNKLDKLMARVLGSVNEESARRFTKTLKALTFVTNPSWDKGFKYLLRKNITPFPINSDDIIPFLLSVVPSIDDLFSSCFWRGTGYSCSEILRLQSTEFGFCYSFNSFSSFRNVNDSEINPPYYDENGEFIGLRTNSEGRSSGIELFIAPKENITLDLDEIILQTVVDSPRTYPPVAKLRPIQPRPGMVYRLETQVQVYRAESSLEQMDQDALPCSLARSDTPGNCQMGCRHRHIWQHCRCVLYTHALLYHNSSVQLCGVDHLKCLAKLSRSLNYISLKHSTVRASLNVSTNSSSSEGMKCRCKPSCAEILYLTNVELIARETRAFTDNYIVYIDAFYFSKWAMGYVNRPKLSVGDLIVGLGGVGGLYLGASFISLIEILVMLIKVICITFKSNSNKIM